MALLLALTLAGGKCEKPLGPLPGPVLAPDHCMSYENQRCRAACYWPGRPDGGSWDDVVSAFAPTREACRKLLEDICRAKRGAPQGHK
jgi:hypothetical protein